MKNLIAQSRQKPVLVAVIAASIFGILIWRMSSSAGSGVAALPMADDASASQAQDVNAAGIADDTRIVDIETSPKASRVDPFRSVVTPTQTSATTPTVATAVPAPKAQAPLQPAVMLGALHPIVPNSSAVVDRDEPKLTGIMSGRPPIGVFQVGTNEEIKKVGESLSDGYVVKSINGRSAVLSRNNARITLSVSASP